MDATPEQVAAGRVLGGVLSEVPLPSPLKEEDQPAAATSFQDVGLLDSPAVERNHGTFVSQEEFPEPVDGEQDFVHVIMIA